MAYYGFAYKVEHFGFAESLLEVEAAAAAICELRRDKAAGHFQARIQVKGEEGDLSGLLMGL